MTESDFITSLCYNMALSARTIMAFKQTYFCNCNLLYCMFKGNEAVVVLSAVRMIVAFLLQSLVIRSCSMYLCKYDGTLVFSCK